MQVVVIFCVFSMLFAAVTEPLRTAILVRVLFSTGFYMFFVYTTFTFGR